MALSSLPECGWHSSAERLHRVTMGLWGSLGTCNLTVDHRGARNPLISEPWLALLCYLLPRCQVLGDTWPTLLAAPSQLGHSRAGSS